MSVVYLAEDPKLGRRIAIKVLPERGEQPEADYSLGDLGQIIREAQLLAAINHPNIATVYSLEEADGHHFLTMELIPGDTLADRLETGPLPIRQALRLCRQIAKALEAAHKSGVAHRDLKPRNIKITPDGLVKVLDFGLATALAGSRAQQIATAEPAELADAIVGTPGYMSPEQLRGGDVDPRSDVWAFGCILFECLTGRRVFAGETIHETIAATHEKDPDFTQLPAETPERISRLLARCLERNLDDRLRTLAEAREEIAEAEISHRKLKVKIRPPSTDVGASRHNLPQQLASFVGREKPLRELQRLLRESRLLTLTGAGGCGKTRLALEVARRLLSEFPNGVWFVELACLVDPTQVPQAVASALGLKEEPNRLLSDTLARSLEGKKTLLVIDNCEHLLKACARLTDQLLRGPSDLRILATSREGLGITGEVIYRVPPLAVPDEGAHRSLEQVQQVEAVQLFTERARAVQSGFAITDTSAPAVSRICRRLDGIPLALELAAARVKTLSVEEIPRRLDDRFSFLTVGSKTSLPQHQTLKALIDWSYDSLIEAEKALFRRLAVFAGGWSLDAAEAVCAGDGIEEREVLDLLAHLIDKSLVEMRAESGSGGDRARYRMLGTVRQYARDRLREAGEEKQVTEKHRDHFLDVAREFEVRFAGPDQAAGLVRLRGEHNNFREALQTCLEEDADPQIGLRLMGALSRYWFMRGHWDEGRRLCAELLARTGSEKETEEQAKVLNLAGNLAFWQGDFKPARCQHERSLAIRRELGDKKGISASLNNLGNVAERLGDYDRANAHYAESIAIRRELGDEWGEAIALNNLGFVAEQQMDYAQARIHHEKSLAIRKKLDDKSGIAMSLNNLGNVAYWLKEYDRARVLHEESITIHREVEDRWATAWTLGDLARVVMHQGHCDEARTLLEESMKVRKDLGDRPGIVITLEAFGTLAMLIEERERAARLLGAAEALREEIHSPASPLEQSELDGTITAVSAKLGIESFAKAWADGRAMSLDRAISYALGEEG